MSSMMMDDKLWQQTITLWTDIAVRICALASFMSAMSVLVIFLVWQGFRATQNRLVFFMALASSVASFAMFMGRWGPLAGLDSFWCQAQFFLIESSLLSASLWASAVSVNLLLTVVAHVPIQSIQRLEPLYHFICFALPMAAPLWTLLQDREQRIMLMDASDSVTWCQWSQEASFIRGLFVYVPVWMAFCIQLITYFWVGQRIWWTEANSDETTPLLPTSHQQENNKTVPLIVSKPAHLLQSTGVLVLVYLLTWTLPTIQATLASSLFTHWELPSSSLSLDDLLSLRAALILSSLKAIANAMQGGWMCLAYVQWALQGIEATRKFLRAEWLRARQRYFEDAEQEKDSQRWSPYYRYSSNNGSEFPNVIPHVNVKHVQTKAVPMPCASLMANSIAKSAPSTMLVSNTYVSLGSVQSSTELRRRSSVATSTLSVSTPSTVSLHSVSLFHDQVASNTLATVLYDFVPEREDELALSKNGLIRVLKSPEGGWWQVMDAITGAMGWVPSNYLSMETPTRRCSRVSSLMF